MSFQEPIGDFHVFPGHGEGDTGSFSQVTIRKLNRGGRKCVGAPVEGRNFSKMMDEDSENKLLYFLNIMMMMNDLLKILVIFSQWEIRYLENRKRAMCHFLGVP